MRRHGRTAFSEFQIAGNQGEDGVLGQDSGTRMFTRDYLSYILFSLSISNFE